MGQLRWAQVPVIFHGFEKNIALAQQLIQKGYYLSLGASLLSGKKDELILELPLDKIFLETDERSVQITDIYTYFCRVRSMDMKVLKEQLYKNFLHIFNYTIGK